MARRTQTKAGTTTTNRSSKPKRARTRSAAIIDPEKSMYDLEEVTFDNGEVTEEAFQPDSLGIASALAGEEVDGVVVEKSYMTETYGGGSIEHVPGFDAGAALAMDIGLPGSMEGIQEPISGTVNDISAQAFEPESVIGNKDTRKPILNPAELPWRCVALLEITYSSGAPGRGTGWFIGPRTLVTAAHCLHDEFHGAARRILVSPGYRAGTRPYPYGKYAVAGSYFNPAWRKSHDPRLDFALIYLKQSPGVGYFGFAAAPESNLRRVIVNITGYPEDKPLTQYFDSGRIYDADKNFIYHHIDTNAGQSGGPVFWTDRNQRIGLGIHTYGSRRINKARRITPPLVDIFKKLAR